MLVGYGTGRLSMLVELDTAIGLGRGVGKNTDVSSYGTKILD